MVGFIFGFIPLVLSSLHLPEDYIVFQWFVGVALLSIALSIQVYRKTSLLFSLLFLFALLNCDYVILFKESYLASLNDGHNIGYRFASSVQLLCVLFTVLGILSLGTEVLKALFSALPLYGAVNALYVIVCAALHDRYTNSMGYSGFLDYSGMNGVLLAVTATSTFARLLDGKKGYHLAFFLLSIVAIYLSKGSIPYGVLLCGIGGVIVSKIGIKKEVFIACLIAAILILGIGMISEGKYLFDSGSRFTAYKIFMSHWYHSGRWFFGIGPGSFQVISQQIQRQTGFMVQGKLMWMWLWLHSDFLQTVFEFGLIGFILLVSVIIQSLLILYHEKETEAFAIACALASSALFDYPARYFVTAFLCAITAIYAYRVRGSNPKVGTDSLWKFGESSQKAS